MRMYRDLFELSKKWCFAEHVGVVSDRVVDGGSRCPSLISQATKVEYPTVRMGCA